MQDAVAPMLVLPKGVLGDVLGGRDVQGTLVVNAEPALQSSGGGVHEGEGALPSVDGVGG